MAEISGNAETSRGFARWLTRERVSLAFTSYQTGWLGLIGVLPSGMLSMNIQLFDDARGLAVSSHDQLFVATRTTLWRLDNALPPGAIADHRFDRMYLAKLGRVVGDLDVHEIGVTAEGVSVFISSKFSCLARPTERGFAALWKPKFVSKLAPEDRCHLNGLAMDWGVARYASACASSDVVNGWHENRVGRGLVIDVETGEAALDGLTMPHSPRLRDGALWVLDSGTGELRRGKETVTFLPGFARGLDFIGRFALVTVSLPRGSDFGGLPLDEALKRKGASPWCGILVIDTRTGDVVEWVRFGEPSTELFAVVALPNVKCPAALGPSSPDLGAWFEHEDLTGP